jgi:hypothetical protein
MTTSVLPRYEHTFDTVEELKNVLVSIGAERALIKILPKNANDKNQIYIASDFGVLFDDFDLVLSERGESTSLTKDRSAPGKRIPEAVFCDFAWLRHDHVLVPARRVKAIIYTQYPEARISGLQAVDGTMPASLSVAYAKQHGDAKRVLVLARLPLGRCVGIVCTDISPAFAAGIAALPGIPRAAACKRLQLDTGSRHMLETKLADVLGRPLRGCRLDAYGRTLPFSGTQVCGYTLEHALGIIPNSNSDGDLYGIELKTHTQLKVTLFTPEPDGGLYAADFTAFMKTYGYRDADGDYRVTGIHRANEQCGKSGLTLRIREQRLSPDGSMQVFPYDRTTPLTPKLDRIDVALVAADGAVAASWSLQRLMNCWGAKHNEVVYIPRHEGGQSGRGRVLGRVRASCHLRTDRHVVPRHHSRTPAAGHRGRRDLFGSGPQAACHKRLEEQAPRPVACERHHQSGPFALRRGRDENGRDRSQNRQPAGCLTGMPVAQLAVNSQTCATGYS